MNKGEVLIYQTANGETSLDVKLEQETIWINRQQMAELFDRDIKTIGKHINNALKEELKGFSTVAKFATVQHEGERIVTRNVEYYNIEMITSVGYRVKSQQGTQFRIWANRVLKEVLMKGYTVKDNIKLEQYEELKQTIKVLANVLDHKTLEYTEATGLLRVVTDYTYALDTLDKYDYQKLEIDETTHKEQFRATYENATTAINKLREKFGGSSLFGNEKDQSFKGSIGRFIKHLAVRISIRVSRRKQRSCYIS